MPRSVSRKVWAHSGAKKPNVCVGMQMKTHPRLGGPLELEDMRPQVEELCRGRMRLNAVYMKDQSIS